MAGRGRPVTNALLAGGLAPVLATLALATGAVWFILDDPRLEHYGLVDSVTIALYILRKRLHRCC